MSCWQIEIHKQTVADLGIAEDKVHLQEGEHELRRWSNYFSNVISSAVFLEGQLPEYEAIQNHCTDTKTC